MATIESLDSDIGAIHDQIAALRTQRANLTSVLLSTPQLATRLEQRPVQHERLRRNAAKTVKRQSSRNLENVYRACAGVTAYYVCDPDPNAVDNGKILGVRIEVFIEGEFVETYHVLFNRPSARHNTTLKIHRHTIPPCIPVRQLQAKHLALPQRDANKTVEQDLIKFGRVLRKELVAWHLRTAAVDKLRTEAGVLDKAEREQGGVKEPAYGKVLNAFVSDDEDEDGEEDGDDGAEYGERRRRDGTVKITDIDADMAVRQISVAWSNGQSAVVEVTKDGDVSRGVARDQAGVRASDLERKIPGRIEGLIERLTS